MFRPGPPRDRCALPERFRFGDVEVDVPGVRVWRGDAVIALEPKAFDLLLLLAANPGRVVEKEEIFARLWTGAAVADNALTRVVTNLRRDLGDDAADARYIETVRTRGYRFVPELMAAASAPPAPLAGPPHAPPATGTEATATTAGEPPRGLRRLPASGGPLALLGAAAVAAAAVAVYLGGRGDSLPPLAAILRPGAPVLVTLPRGYNGMPSFSPDGLAIAYTSEREGALDIFVRSIGDGSELQLTSGGGNVDPAFSPDGRWVAYHSGSRGGVWLVSSLGGVPRQLTSYGSQPSWSPDGREIVFHTLDSLTLSRGGWPGTHGTVLAAVSLAGGRVRQLTMPGRPPGGHGEPAWMPGGDRIVFAAGDDEHSGIYLVSADGARLETVVESSADVPGPRCSWEDPVPLPDGSAVLAVARTRQYSIVALPLTGTRREAIPILPLAPFGTFRLALTADRSRLAYTVPAVDSSIDAVAVDANGRRAGAPRTLASDPDLRALIPTYSPDGRFLLYLRRHPGAASDFVAVDVATRERRELGRIETPGSRWLHWSWTSPTEALFDPWMHGIGIDLVTLQRRSTGAAPGFSRIRERYRPIAPMLRLSPDGTAAVFAAQAESAQELFLWQVGNEEARQLTRLKRVASFPFWSPDSARIAFQVVYTDDSSNELWQVHVPSRTMEKLPTAPGLSWGGGFQPSGPLIAFAARRGTRWDLAVVAPGTPERCLGVSAPENTYLRWPAWSPSGAEIAYERTTTRADIWMLPLAAAR